MSSIRVKQYPEYHTDASKVRVGDYLSLSAYSTARGKYLFVPVSPRDRNPYGPDYSCVSVSYVSDDVRMPFDSDGQIASSVFERTVRGWQRII